MKKAVLIFTVICLTSGFAETIFAQRQHYTSPLYSPRSYEEDINKSTVGLPDQLKEVGIEQKLNEQLPLDTIFKNEEGNEVALGEYFAKGKPVVLALVYYECPMLCNEVLNGLVRSVKPLSLTPGKDFEIVAISFDARELPELAKAKKETYLAKYDRAGTENGWHFLTGSQDSIDKITKAVGFNFRWDEKSNQFAHAGGITLVTPDGKVSRYLYGIEYAPKDVKLGLIESAASKIGNPVDQLLLYCYHYDPSTGKYGLAIMRLVRVAGALTVLGMAVLLFGLWRYKKNPESE